MRNRTDARRALNRAYDLFVSRLRPGEQDDASAKPPTAR